MAGRGGALLEEQELLRTRTHPRVLALPLAVLLTSLACAGFAAARVPPGDWQRAGRALVAAVTAVVVVRWAVLPWLRWLGTVLWVTERRLVVQQGVLRRASRSVPLSRVVDVEVHRSLGQRLLGSGTLVLPVAGEGRGERGVVLRDVPRARELARLVEDLLDDVPPRWDDGWGHGWDDGWDDDPDDGGDDGGDDGER
ncbi:MAG TPA: PH domain-containing protein [Mycobacteriales bacterium]|nr:PH domain-containing protein [Mycobacteriales bacterium]